MIQKKQHNKSEKKILIEIINKLEILILLSSLQGKNKNEKIKMLKNYRGDLSKRELEKITGIDRHDF